MHAPLADPLARSLATALIISSDGALLLLDRAATVVAVSEAFCTAFNLSAEHVQGSPIYALGDGEWDSPRLHALLDATLGGVAKIETYEIDFGSSHGPRRLVLNAKMIQYDDPLNARLLLAVSDVTAARASARLNADLTRDNSILLQQVEQRIANSLQIIASVLIQGARWVQAGESRSIGAAHPRTRSVAAIQQHLAASTSDLVDLSPYLTQLCQSLAASMIEDPRHIGLTVEAAEATVAAGVAVSLGLIVTELVINALRHAFPFGLGGAIVVRYAAVGGAWELSVTDDGIGMPTGHDAVQPGLGTGIVQALAKQLGAHVETADAAPGTRCAVVRTLRGPREVRPLAH